MTLIIIIHRRSTLTMNQLTIKNKLEDNTIQKESLRHAQNLENKPQTLFKGKIQAKFLEIKLEHLYQMPKGKGIAASKLTYYHSLVPKVQLLKENRKIVFNVGLVPEAGKERIHHENMVNTHLFKPYYVDEGSHIACFVPTQQIMKHSLAALFQVHEHYQIRHPTIVANLKEEPVLSLISHWTIQKKVILCRVESLMTYLLIEWLKEASISFETIKEIILQIQLSRLSHKRVAFETLLKGVLAKHNLRVERFIQSFNITKQSSRSPFIYGFNFEYQSHQVSAVMLPWGLSMAKEVTEAVLALNPAVIRVGVVGGVGYIGTSDCEVDDIFVPHSYLAGDENDHSVVHVENAIIDAPQAVHFPEHNTVFGCLKSVFPEVGKLSNIAAYRGILHKIDALDMEFEAIYAAAKTEEREVGAIYYTMDLPQKDIHLGDTYYSLPFLQKLFRKFKRGKFHCFEKVIGFLSK